ncbi:MAG: molybdenum ABC transporter ATP-binding protein [Alphaproteobacteria bacterium]|nr:molybdenum ABC transporter ATP-binding protein [Alphaproteobacteria bacterium]
MSQTTKVHEPLIQGRFRANYGSFQLNAEFQAPAQGITAIFGHSGSGKTSLLRAIAGLNRIVGGFFRLDEEIWQDDHMFRPVHHRPLGYVFQEASLFAHLSIKANLLYGAPRAGDQQTIGFDEVVDLLGISALLDRAPHHLSGGERQRIAIGRALLSQPKLLLMDEPLSALDRQSKDEILPFLERLHDTLALPVLYVSHDMSEIERLADHLILMDKGSVRASGPLSQMQSDPALPLLVSSDAAVSLDAIVESHDPADGMTRLQVAGGSFLVPSAPAQIGEHRRLRILAGDVSLAREQPLPSTIVNILPAKILSMQTTGQYQMTAVIGLGEDGQGARLLTRVTRRSWNLLNLAPGCQVYAQVKGVALVGRQSQSQHS